MRDRDERRTIPDRGNYFHVDLEERGRHDFRVPPPTKFGALIDLMSGEDMRALADKANAAESGEVSEAIGETMEQMCGQQGALIGVCWWGADMDLDTRWNGKRETLEAFGVAVYEELWDEDYTVTDIMRMWAVSFKQIVATFTKQEELAGAMDFTSATAPPSGSITTLESRTSETSGAGGA